jgi:hypothetical protein
MKLSSKSSSSFRCSRSLLAFIVVSFSFAVLAAPSLAVVTDAQEIQPVDERDDDDDDDVTILMKQRIESIQKYLNDPIQHLNQMSLLVGLNGEYQEEGERMAMDMVQVLFDLEDEFENSASKTREFYNLGGWRLLASLVSKSAHMDKSSSSQKSISYSCNTADDSDDDDLVSMQENILLIRASAADAMGTAVKNRDEFHSWVLEEQVVVVMSDGSTAPVTPTTTTTPLDLVTRALVEVSDAAETPGSCSKLTLEDEEELASKTMYALESFLRGNAPAQAVFSTITILEDDDKNNVNSASNPAQILGRQVARWALEAAVAASDTQSSNARMSRHAIKMTRTLLALANDLVRDVPTAQDASVNNQAIIDVFSTNDWCQAAMQAAILSPASSFKRLVFSPLQRTALQSVTTLGSHCSNYYKNDGKELVADLTRLYHQQLLESEKEAAATTTNTRRGTHKPDIDQINFQLVELALAAVVTNESSNSSLKPLSQQSAVHVPVNTQMVYDLRVQRAVRA